MEITTQIIAGLIALGLLALLIYALRGLTHWYFGISEHLANQKEIIKELKKLNNSNFKNV